MANVVPVEYLRDLPALNIYSAFPSARRSAGSGGGPNSANARASRRRRVAVDVVARRSSRSARAAPRDARFDPSDDEIDATTREDAAAARAARSLPRADADAIAGAIATRADAIVSIARACLWRSPRAVAE